MRQRKEVNRDPKKQLMWAVSVSLSRPEAISFANTLDKNEDWYLVKVSENPKARHIGKRERFVVVRYPKDGEIVGDGHALFIMCSELVGITNRPYPEATNMVSVETF